MKQYKEAIAVIVFHAACLAGLATLFGIWCELGLDLSLPFRCYLILIAWLFVTCVYAYGANPGRVKLVLFTAWIAGLLVLHVVPWTPRKVFERDVGRIQIGMSELEVDQIMASYIRAGQAGCLVFRHNDDDPKYDADAGIVRFLQGRVVAVDFIMD
ncbi:MAG: hypothetical protein AB7K24_08650 [Gemmataceae bacterium]